MRYTANHPSQQSINEAEWQNEDNWSGPGPIAFYFSKKDTRTWVPKKIPALGWTVNLGHPAGAWWMVGFLVGTPLMVVLALVATMPG